ncbi:MAG: hypothetical protein MRJ68_00695 [Nitrospira sp.]|nr:hypothetical protein [Nitrospira sp.]
MRHVKFLPGRGPGVGPEVRPTFSLAAGPLVAPGPIVGGNCSAEAIRDWGARGLKVQPRQRTPGRGPACGARLCRVATYSSWLAICPTLVVYCLAARTNGSIAPEEEALEGVHLRGIGLRAGPDSLKGSAAHRIDTQESGAAALLTHQLHQGLKEILEGRST